MAKKKICFVICPFGLPDSAERKRSDMLLEYVIEPAVQAFDYAVDRADLSVQPGIVTVHVIQHLIEDDLLIADITDRNPNVFYELAIRHAIRKPYVQLMSEDQRIPFNIQEIQTILYDLHDVKTIKNCVDRIKKQILYYETGGKVTSPVTVAIDELIGSRSLQQFTELVEKLSALDAGILEARQLNSKIEELKEAVELVSSRISSLSSQSRSESTGRSDSGSAAKDVEDFQSKLRVPGRMRETTIGDYLEANLRKFGIEIPEPKEKGGKGAK